MAGHIASSRGGTAPRTPRKAHPACPPACFVVTVVQSGDLRPLLGPRGSSSERQTRLCPNWIA
eukprot:11272842-Alexandrium_andersonii.AAC.1